VRLLPLLAAAGLLAACSGDPSSASSPRPAVAKAAPSPTAAWAAGQCVTVSFDGGAGPAQTKPATALPCSAPGAAAQIIKVVSAVRDCPSRTDGMLGTPAGGQACVRNLAGPHPGDPGKGGGILLVGDCIYSTGAQPVERPCYDRHGPGKIKSFLRKKSQCHDSQGYLDDYYTTKRDDPDRPIICHGEGGDVEKPGPAYAVGECVKKPKTYKGLFPGSTETSGLDTVGCGTKSAWAKVVANTKVAACPSGATESVTDIHRYPSTTCLRRL
jgi:hypothetical protein